MKEISLRSIMLLNINVPLEENNWGGSIAAEQQPLEERHHRPKISYIKI